MLVASLMLKNPAQIFDELKETSSNPQASASLEQMEQALKLSLRDDLLSQLTGEVTIEVDSVIPPDAIWKVMLRTNDVQRLQTTLNTLLAQTPLRVQQADVDGITYHMFQMPAQNKMMEIAYAFVDGYLVIASGRKTLTETVELHRSGESLARSKKFLEALPPGYTSSASLLFYEDPLAVAALTMRQASSELAELVSHSGAENKAVVVIASAEPNVIREVSRSNGVDSGAILVGAAIAIPNLLRARMAANESSAVATLRTANTAQAAYASTYPERGYARSFAVLGSGAAGSKVPSAEHALLVDESIGNSTCVPGAWCAKSGFQFSMKALCVSTKCGDYVAVATPLSASTGTRSFCTTSDVVIRWQTGPLLTAAISARECKTWPPLQ
jgi:type IV pilus assembly protein PilA